MSVYIKFFNFLILLKITLFCCFFFQSYLDDSLKLLEEICAQPKFGDALIFVFLNKVDLFAEKLKEVPLCDYMKEYTGEFLNDHLIILLFLCLLLLSELFFLV